MKRISRVPSPPKRAAVLIACVAAALATAAPAQAQVERLSLTPAVAANLVGTTHYSSVHAEDGNGPVQGASIVFSVSGTNTQAPTTLLTDSSGNAYFPYVGTQAGTDTITAFADNNANGTLDTGEPQRTATKRWLSNQPQIALSPQSASNQIRTPHTVTATVSDGTGTVAGVNVYFALTGANQPYLGTSVRCKEDTDNDYWIRTNESGEASCTYTGLVSGPDTITALADTNNDYIKNNNENSASANKGWTTTSVATLKLSPAVATNFLGVGHTVSAHAEAAGGAPVPNASIVFSASGPNPQTETARLTDGAGNTFFTYTGTQAGTDTITAFADNNGNGTHDAGEPLEAATKRWIANQPQISLSPPSATNQVRTPHTVTATVSDGTGPMSGVNVLFSLAGANQPYVGQYPRCKEDTDGDYFIRTDATGQASCTYTGQVTGTDTITALADTNNDGAGDNSENSATATKNWTTTAVATLTLTPGVAANFIGQQHYVYVHAEAPGGAFVPGASIVFSVSGPNPQSETARFTDGAGNTYFNYTGTQSGTDTITAFADSNGNGTHDAGEPLQTATKRWLGTQPQISLSPPSASNQVRTPHTVTATVTDGTAPVAGVNVLFSVAGANQPYVGQYPRCKEDTDGDYFIRTDTSGQASCTYTGQVAGTDTITALADTNNDGAGDNSENSATATKNWTTTAVATLTLTPGVAANFVGVQHYVYVHAEAAGGAAVPNASIVLSVSGSNPQSATPRLTDGAGNTSFNYSGAQSGTDTITAFADNNGNGTPDPGEPQQTATKRWLAAQPLIALSPPSASNRVGTPHTLTATVSDGVGPVAGVNVLFSVAGANQPYVGQYPRCKEDTDGDYFIRTDASGQASCTYTGQVTGDDTITALADTNNNGAEDNGESTATATKTWTPGSTGTTATTLSLSPGTAANLVGARHYVYAHAEDAVGPVQNVSIVFSVGAPNTQPPTAQPTDGAGNATFSYVGSQAGTDTITAFADNNANGTRDAGEPQQTVSKRWLANQPAISLSPPSASNQIRTAHTVTATVTQATAPLEGANVYFSLAGANLPYLGTSVRCEEDTDGDYFIRTNASGQASCTYRGVVAGRDTITALADTNNNYTKDNNENSADATKSWTTTPVSTFNLTPDVATNFIGTRHYVYVHAEAAGGAAVPNASVVYSVSGPNPQSPTPLVTDSGGNTYFSYIGSQAGTDTIVAFVDNDGNGTRDAGEPQQTATKRWLANQPAISLAPPSASNQIRTSHTVTATVSDGAGPVAGVNVRFSLAGANQPYVGQYPACREDTDGDYFIRTDSSGHASCTYTGAVAGLDTITALADTNDDGVQDNSESSAMATKSWSTTPAATLTLTPEVAANFLGVRHYLYMHAEAAGGAPVPGVPIVFSVSGANARPPVPLPTDGNGNTYTYYDGTQSGADTITAFADNNGNGTRDAGEPEQTATKRWLSTQPQITLSPPSASNQIRTPHTVTATVTDGIAPVAGVNVRFSLAGANQPYVGQYPACQEDTDGDSFIRTDSSGHASCTYTGAVAGLDTITALADTNDNGAQDNGESSATATKSWSTTDVATLSLTPDLAANFVGVIHYSYMHAEAAGGAPVPGASIVVSVSGPNARSSVLATDSGGNAAFAYQGTQAGTDTITAFADNNGNGTRDAGEPQQTATKHWLDTQPSITLAPQSATNPRNTPHTVTATVTDATGAVGGVNVLFSIAGVNGNGLIRCVEDTNGDYFIRTDTNGKASCTYTGTITGDDTITAFADTNNDGAQSSNENSATATKTWVPGGPAGTIEVVKRLNPRDDQGRFNLQIDGTTRATSAGHNSSTTAILVAAGTNHSVGETAASGTSLGDYTSQIACTRNGSAAENGSGTSLTNITVGANDTVVCTITNTRAAITLSPKSARNAVGTSHTVTATVRGGGQAVSGAQVLFTVTGANPSSQQAKTTDALGQAVLTYTGQNAGTDTITACYDLDSSSSCDSSEQVDTASKTWTSAAVVPKSATPLLTSLVVAYHSCSSPNRTHGGPPPLSAPSCNAPAQTSSQLTVGTLDSNGQRASSVGSVRYDAVLGDPGTAGNQADVALAASITDVRKKSDLTDYTGQLLLTETVRITDTNNAVGSGGGTDSATVTDIEFPATLPCVSTASTDVGSTCSLTTTFNAIQPGAIVEANRAIWQLGTVNVFDGGPDGVASTTPNTLFETQGIFVP
jgi:hypothetical protein